LLADFSQLRLIKVVQGAAGVTMVLNVIALWKQEVRDPARTDLLLPRMAFGESWAEFTRDSRTTRFLVALGLGTAAFSMQDIILEPYGAEILNLSVGSTTALTALLAGGSLCAFALAARWLSRGADPLRLAAYGTLVGIVAFAAVIFADPLDSPLLFRLGTSLIGFGGGLFSVATLTAAMALEGRDHSGLALGAWGAVQASAAGVAVAFGGGLRDAVSGLATQGLLGPGVTGASSGYELVYQLEIGLLFVTLVAIGPLVGSKGQALPHPGKSRFGIAEFPG
jgi:BCD family chlorophyll transporter-like MFS transporter